MASAEISGSTEEMEDVSLNEDDGGEWQTVKGNKSHRRPREITSDSDNEIEAGVKRQRGGGASPTSSPRSDAQMPQAALPARHLLHFPPGNKMDYHARVRWIILDLVKAHPDVDVRVDTRRNVVSVTVDSAEIATLLTTDGLSGVVLVPSQPYEKVSKVLIHDCPLGIDPEYICRDPRVIWVKRRVARGQDQPQLIALVRGDAPSTLELEYLGDRKVVPYVEPPQLCFKCSKWGHKALQCRGTPRCRYCSGFHEARECVAKLKEGQKIPPRCPNCGGRHNASAWVCPRHPRVGPPPTRPQAGSPPTRPQAGPPPTLPGPQPPPGDAKVVGTGTWADHAASRAVGAGAGVSPAPQVAPPPRGQRERRERRERRCDMGGDTQVAGTTDMDAGGDQRRTDLDDSSTPQAAGMKDLQGQLDETRQVLAETRQVLAETRQDLAETRQVLAETRQDLAETRQVLAETRQALQDNQRVLAETQQALRDVQAQPCAPQQEGVGGDLRAELDGLHARQMMDIEDLKGKLAESGQVLAETRQALLDNQRVLAKTQQVIEDAGTAPCAPQQEAAKPMGPAAVFGGPPDILDVVGLIERFLGVDPKIIYGFAMTLQDEIQGLAPTVSRRRLQNAVEKVLEKYERAWDDST